MDDQRLGSTLRAIRRSRRLRQADIALKASVSQATVSRVERGFLDTLSLKTLRAILAVLEIRLALSPLWRGPDLERLLDEDHARLVAEVGRILEKYGWEVVFEATYSRFGERGSIDILAVHPANRIALIVEVKTRLVSVELLVRRVDEKHRLAAHICAERFGWRPLSVSKLLVVADGATQRRIWLKHAGVLGRAFPESGARRIRSWLRQPLGELSACWFLSTSHPRTGRCIRQRRQGERCPVSRSNRTAPGV